MIIKNGVGNELTISGATTIGEIRNNAGYQSVLRFSSNDTFRLNGYSTEDGRTVSGNDVVTIEKAACSKAA